MIEYKNPASTVDLIVPSHGRILLIRRRHEPFKDMWALPGGHLNYGVETLEETATRELGEETGLRVLVEDMKLVGVYSDPKRDPRGHYITHVYVAVKFNGHLQAGDDAAEARFFPVDGLPKLAFDHDTIITDYSEVGG